VCMKTPKYYKLSCASFYLLLLYFVTYNYYQSQISFIIFIKYIFSNKIINQEYLLKLWKILITQFNPLLSGHILRDQHSHLRSKNMSTWRLFVERGLWEHNQEAKFSTTGVAKGTQLTWSSSNEVYHSYLLWIDMV